MCKQIITMVKSLKKSRNIILATSKIHVPLNYNSNTFNVNVPKTDTLACSDSNTVNHNDSNFGHNISIKNNEYDHIPSAN